MRHEEDQTREHQENQTHKHPTQTRSWRLTQMKNSKLTLEQQPSNQESKTIATKTDFKLKKGQNKAQHTGVTMNAWTQTRREQY